MEILKHWISSTLKTFAQRQQDYVKVLNYWLLWCCAGYIYIFGLLIDLYACRLQKPLGPVGVIVSCMLMTYICGCCILHSWRMAVTTTKSIPPTSQDREGLKIILTTTSLHQTPFRHSSQLKPVRFLGCGLGRPFPHISLQPPHACSVNACEVPGTFPNSIKLPKEINRVWAESSRNPDYSQSAEAQVRYLGLVTDSEEGLMRETTPSICVIQCYGQVDRLRTESNGGDQLGLVAAYFLGT